jgi:hypothetical protein
MSLRRRTIAGAPVRTASESADLVVEMLRETLAPATAIDQDTVQHELDGARDALRMLISAQHLTGDPLVLMAEPLRLEINVAGGAAALKLQENLGKVSGAATAQAFCVHLPAPAPLTAWIEGSLSGLKHITTAPAPAESPPVEGSAAGPLGIDLEALRRVAGGRS